MAYYNGGGAYVMTFGIEVCIIYKSLGIIHKRTGNIEGKNLVWVPRLKKYTMSRK